MPVVVVTFHDGEVLHVETPDLTFDLPVLEAEIRSVGSNSLRAILPLTAIRQIVFGDPEPAPTSDVLATWDRAAFHFTDGEVLRAWIAPDVHLGMYGGVWRIVRPGSDEIRVLAAPYSSLKGVFQLREWDSRSLPERRGRAQAAASRVDTIVRALAERETRQIRRPLGPAPTPLLDRLRRADSSAEDDTLEKGTPGQ